MDNLLALAKATLSIISTSTAKDTEITMLIEAAKKDLERQNININTDNNLVITAIIMFVKGHFGNVDIKEKELAQNTYKLLCTNLSLSEEYKGE